MPYMQPRYIHVFKLPFTVVHIRSISLHEKGSTIYSVEETESECGKD